MVNERKKEKEKNQWKSRDPKWAFWETFLVIQVVITVRDKYAQVIGNAEMMCEFNRVYVDLIEECEKQNQCVYVQNNTRTTPISRHFEKILCVIHNHLLPLLNKILDDDHIPFGQQIEDVREDLRVMYYKEKKMDGVKPDNGDSDGDDDGTDLTLQMEDFHPHEFYVFYKWGPQ